MIVKIHSRGEGGGDGPVDYLLGKDRERELAEVLRGNPEEVRELIDACPYARKYTSGVLSFLEPDLPAEQKEALMDSFEQALLPGLDADQYSIAWIQHRDKDRLELNFLVPNTELLSGKRLQPYYDRADRTRINAWKSWKNAELDLHDPDDPANRQELIRPADLPRDKKAAVEKITDGLLAQIRNGRIKNRNDVISTLQKRGYTIAREIPSSISIADPDGGRNIRLKGTIYEQAFRDVRGLQQELEAASGRYRADREGRLRRAREIYQERFEGKRAKNQKRYRRPPESDPVVDTQGLDAGGPDHLSGSGWDARHRLGPGPNHRGQTENHRAAETRDRESGTNDRTIGSTDVGDHPARGQEGPVHHPVSRPGDRYGLETRRPENNQTDREGGLNDDATRNLLIERLAGLAQRIRNAAHRVYEICRGIADNVRQYTAEKRGDRESIEALDHAIEGFVKRKPRRQSQRRYDRQPGD